MNKTLAILFLLATPLFTSAQTLKKDVKREASQEISWVSIEEAQEMMKNEPRKIIMDVYTSWCGPCKMMMANTFTNPDLIEYINENYYAVKFNAESPDPLVFNGKSYSNPDYDPARKGRNGVHEFARFLGVRAYPTIMYIDEELNLLYADSGYKLATQMEILMKFFVEDQHKNVKTQEEWDTYQAEFKPAWKEIPKQ